jgi:hypothetical protein
MSTVKRWLPAPILRGLRSAREAAEYRLYRAPHRRLWLRDLSRAARVVDTGAVRPACEAGLVGWLRAAQDAAPGGGVAGFYDFASGWSAAYPETTGYIIATCLEIAQRRKDQELAERARRMAQWELSVQLPSGAWQSGLIGMPVVPAVFNTGQVIQGLVAAHGYFGGADYLEGATRGARWLLEVQDPDGAWRRDTYNNLPNTYSTRVAWPLLELARMTGDQGVRSAALRYLEWAGRCQDETGYLESCALEVDEDPLTHTLAYAAEGFIESGALLEDTRWVHAGQRVADALLRRFETRRHLAGTYGQGWKGDDSFTCLTGCAQTARIWGRLYELTGDARYVNAMLKLNDFVLGLVDLDAPWPEVRGGVSGSYPVWGPYMRFRLPSWAAKFTLDAILVEEDVMRHVRGESR